MSHPTFKEFLVTEAAAKKKVSKKKVSKKKAGEKKEKIEKDEKGKLKLFNPENFYKKAINVLDLMVKSDDPMMNELIMLEMISIFKEVFLERLEPYVENPKYKERKDSDDQVTAKSISDQVDDTLRTHFNATQMKRPIGRFMTLIVDPILSEVERVGFKRVTKLFDHNHFDQKSRDAFGALMRHIINSEILPNAEDKAVAEKVLVKWAAEARSAKRKTRKLTKAQRMQAIHNAVMKVQGE